MHNLLPNIEIDLSKIKANYDKIKGLTKIGASVSAVVKANAYGLGARQIAHELYQQGCRRFYVAYLEEALDLEMEKRDVEIIILQGCPADQLEICLSKKFIPNINSLSQAQQYQAYARAIGSPIKCALQIDTGMTRAGISEHEIADFLKLDHIKIHLVMSHLACASNRKHPMNLEQLTKVKRCFAHFPSAIKSFANSAGVLLGEEFHFDDVRPGCALYGINPMDNEESIFLNVCTLKAYITQIRTLPNDATVSYNASHIATQGSVIATASVGYADGFKRCLSNNSFAYTHGYKIPIIGTITMDMIMMDISHLPIEIQANLEFVELIGQNSTVDQLAISAKTIGYEILTSLGNRIKRVYL